MFSRRKSENKTKRKKVSNSVARGFSDFEASLVSKILSARLEMDECQAGIDDL